MKTKERIELIHLLGEELHDTATAYNKVAGEDGIAISGYEIDRLETREAIKRRITVLREELLQLSKSL